MRSEGMWSGQWQTVVLLLAAVAAAEVADQATGDVTLASAGSGGGRR